MKTEDLKNYIFEQLNETSYALQQRLYNGRRDQAHRAAATAHDIHVKNMKMAGKTGPLDPSLMAVRGLFVNDMDKAFASAKKADNRSKKLLLKRLVQTGDGSPNYSPKQESAFNFINGLKRLQENSRRRKDAKDSAEQNRYGWTMKDSRVQDYADKMYPEPDDVSEFENEQLKGRRIEAEIALRRRENPHNIKKNIRDMLFTIKK